MEFVLVIVASGNHYALDCVVGTLSVAIVMTSRLEPVKTVADEGL